MASNTDDVTLLQAIRDCFSSSKACIKYVSEKEINGEQVFVTFYNNWIEWWQILFSKDIVSLTIAPGSFDKKLSKDVLSVFSKGIVNDKNNYILDANIIPHLTGKRGMKLIDNEKAHLKNVIDLGVRAKNSKGANDERQISGKDLKPSSDVRLYYQDALDFLMQQFLQSPYEILKKEHPWFIDCIDDFVSKDAEEYPEEHVITLYACALILCLNLKKTQEINDNIKRCLESVFPGIENAENKELVEPVYAEGSDGSANEIGTNQNNPDLKDTKNAVSAFFTDGDKEMLKSMGLYLNVDSLDYIIKRLDDEIRSEAEWDPLSAIYYYDSTSGFGRKWHYDAVITDLKGDGYCLDDIYGDDFSQYDSVYRIDTSGGSYIYTFTCEGEDDPLILKIAGLPSEAHLIATFSRDEYDLVRKYFIREKAINLRDDLIDEIDPIYKEAKDYIIRKQKGSTSLLQRKFRLGYNRAMRLMDRLEQTGIIGTADGIRPRVVYYSPDPLFEKAKAYVICYQEASTSFLKEHLGISRNYAARLIDELEEAEVIAPSILATISRENVSLLDLEKADRREVLIKPDDSNESEEHGHFGWVKKLFDKDDSNESEENNESEEDNESEKDNVFDWFKKIFDK